MPTLSAQTETFTMPTMPLDAAIRKAYEGRARQEEIATALGVTQPTISRWARGESAPDVDQLVAFEDFLGRPRGFVLMAAGYVDCPLTVEDAIRMDAALDDHDRRNLTNLYRSMIERNGSTD